MVSKQDNVIVTVRLPASLTFLFGRLAYQEYGRQGLHVTMTPAEDVEARFVTLTIVDSNFIRR